MGYDINRIQKEFIEICNKANVECSVPIKINARLTRTLGRVTSSHNHVTDVVTPTLVEFSKSFIETSTDKSIRDVILHEASHFIVTSRTKQAHGHDAKFREVCMEIGAIAMEPQTKVEKTIAEDKSYKYAIYCDAGCGGAFLTGYSRMCNTLKNIDRCTCPKCGGSKLKVIQNW